MSGYTKNSGPTKARGSRIIRVAPTTRAIRSALAVSATMLALAGSGLAYAGTCTVTGAATVSCNGVFNDQIPGIHFVPPADLTLVLGDTGPTSVTPGAGVIAVLANWAGITTVTTSGKTSIITNGADGIHQYSNVAATLTNHGDITTTVTGAGQNAVDISSLHTVDLTNDGSISAFAAIGSVADVTAVYASSVYGDINIDNQAGGNISAGANSGNATAVYAYSEEGNVNVNNDGIVSASSFNGNATGIAASAYHGDVSVTNGGDINAYSLSGDTMGVFAFAISGGNATISNDGTVDVGGAGQAIGVQAVSAYGTGTVNNTGSIDAISYADNAIGAQAGGKYAVVANGNGGTITAIGQYGAIGINAQGTNGVSITNAGDVTATSAFGYVYGIAALSISGDVSINSSGSVTATDGAYSYNATGIETLAEGTSAVINSGDVTVDGLHATGIDSQATNGNSTVVNSGSIDVRGVYGIGITATSEQGDTAVTNSGDILVNGYLVAGIVSYTLYGAASVNSSGSVEANGQYTALGILANGYDSAAVINSGDVIATADGSIYGGAANIAATGISAQANYNGNATVANSGDVTVVVSGTYSANDSFATGITAYAFDGDAIVNSSGSVSVTSTIDAYDGSSAVGISASSYNFNAIVTNSGSVDVSDSYGRASGIVANSYSGNSSVSSSGPVTVDGYSSATGIYASSVNGTASITNSGHVDVLSPNFATGIYGYTGKYGSDVAITNSGTVTVDGLNANGIVSTSKYGDSTVTNSGDITVTGDTSVGIDSSAKYYGNNVVTSSGHISVTGDTQAVGISADTKQGNLGSIRVINSGDITATSELGIAGGIVATGYHGTSVANSGNISVSGYYYGVGVIAQDVYGNVSVVNSGHITVDAGAGLVNGANAVGINARDTYGSIVVTNSGSIDVGALGDSLYGSSAVGITAYAVYGEVGVTNSGSIAASAESTKFAYGSGTTATAVTVTDVYGNVTISNTATGNISADATATDYFATATGINILAFFGDISVASQGSISASAVTGVGDTYVSAAATGISAVASVYGTGAVTINSSGSVSATARLGNNSDYSSANASGITVEDHAGAISITNSGDVQVDASTGGGTLGNDNSAYAYGISAYNYDGAITIVNSGSVDVTADSSGSAYSFSSAVGVYAIIATDGYGAITITNSAAGSVSATANNTAIGIEALSYGSAPNYAHINITSSGDIDATADGGDDAIATGILARGYTVGVTNNGDIAVVANGVNTATGSGVSAYAYDVTFNGGAGSTNTVHATAEDDARAIGVGLIGNNVNATSNGSISSTATAYAEGGSAHAFGLGVLSEAGVVSTGADGSISATATGYLAEATALYAVGYYSLGVDNASDLHALATGSDGHAIGLLALLGGESSSNLGVTNSGAITARFVGANGYAIGAHVINAAGDVTFTNSGSITATDADYAVGVELDAKYGSTTTLTNTGTITAVSTAAGSIAILTGDANDYIRNSGTINGAIVTGNGDDYLRNVAGGVWNAVGTSDFGNGDDKIVNGGRINMNNATISLGGYAEGGNQFINSLGGTIHVNGNANVINMGQGISLVPSLNPNPFYNYGVIDFQDGVPNDILTIVGDFGGDGVIKVDVSGLLHTSDLLYIDGSVVSGDTNTINVSLLNLPNTSSVEIPIVYVSGNSVAGSFALGTVNYAPNSFLAVGFNLISHINAANTANDVFALGINVNGLSDSGALAASIAPGVESLMNSQVGTWRQRMGVIDQFQDHAWSLWARIFQDKGSLNPTQLAANFGQGGNYDFDQKNSGVEAGVDFAISDEFSMGLLLAKSRASQDLNNPGVGHSKIKGDTYGVYATWIGESGYYVDGSYRWMSFDATLNSAAGEQKASGDAETFNVEAGYAWVLGSGLKIEPQVQYTHTRVDNIDLIVGPGGSFQSDGGVSSRGRVGVAFRKSYGSPGGTIWTPYATLSAVREFDGENDFAVNGLFNGSTDISGTSALVEAGFTAQTGNLSVYGGLNWQDGGAYNRFVGGQLGVRYTFGHHEEAPAPMAPMPAKTCADLDDDGDGVNNCDDKCPGSTAGQAVGPDGCPVPLTIDLKGVNFDFDKMTLRPDAVAILDEAIAILGKYPDLKVAVVGHTDSIGSEVYNQGLSERRARTVFDYLSGHGVNAGRLAGPTGYGETRPIAPNTNEDGTDNPEGRAKNRRTELDVEN